MPDDGIETNEDRGTDIKGYRHPAIAVTAYRGRREELLAEGFAELIEKPLDPLRLCATVRIHARTSG